MAREGATAIPVPDEPAGGRQAAADRFRQFLRERGLKYTAERQEVLRLFFTARRHLEAEELLGLAQAAGARVSRATIYRTLDLLVQAGLARKVRLGAEHVYYEHVLGRRQHEHMICLRCEKVIEWYDPQLEAVLQANVDRHGFTAARSSVQIFGYCADCRD